jgi:hypothetical protein
MHKEQAALEMVNSRNFNTQFQGTNENGLPLTQLRSGISM